MHTVFARRIGRARDDLAGLAGVAVAADNDWQAGKFRVAAHLDRSLELVDDEGDRHRIDGAVLSGHAFVIRFLVQGLQSMAVDWQQMLMVLAPK